MSETEATWVIDGAHSAVGFTVRHLVSKVRGNFSGFEGKIVGDSRDLTTARAEFTVQMNSVNTNQADRDQHLKTSDFFDVATYPTMRFESTTIERIDDTTYTVHGRLTMRGVTKEIPVKVEVLGVTQDPWGGTRAGFECRARVNRKDFNVNWNQVLEAGGVMVGDNVDISLDLETMKQ